MNEYLKRYIELKKQFVATNNSPDSVRSLYAFKEELEYMEEEQAKEVLVDVYDLLDFKKDAYDLLCQIGNRSDKKTLKRLGTLKDYAEIGETIMLSRNPKRQKKSRARKNSGSNWVCLPFGITQTLWILGLLMSPKRVLSATVAVRPPISFIPIRSSPLRILRICVQSVSLVVQQPGSITVAFKMICLWMMV